jgi:hypothetical protein
MCFDNYNKKGGSVVPLQTGGFMYFPRAVILAIYADHPAAVKCTSVGKACPQCFTPEDVMDLPPANGEMTLRTDTSNKRMVDTIIRVRDSGFRGYRGRANKRARKLGVNLLLFNPFSNDDEKEWVFGPHPERDSIFQCVPQPVLHGMDEGITAKLARGAVELAIADCFVNFGWDATKVFLQNIHVGAFMMITLADLVP